MSFEGVLFDRYQVRQLLGRGGMGEVYLAEDSRIRRQVAIKVVRGELSAYPDAERDERSGQLFEHEMKVISQLDHPHILPLYDYGETEVNGTMITYMVMPYRPEGSLLTWLRQRKSSEPLSSQDVATFIGQAADALYHAHERQIIHQDVKPSNFLIRVRAEKPEQPDLLLTDFGISRFTTTVSKTSQGVQGTPTYMAPEQWEGHPTYASDQYALAVMAYELLVGRAPFEGRLESIMFKHVNTAPPSPTSLKPVLAPAFDEVLLRALAKKPAERFASIAEFARAFQQACNAESVTIVRMRPPTITGSGRLANVGESGAHAELKISMSEAASGASRVLTIDDQTVTVTIPPNAWAGQMIRVENWRKPAGGEQSAESLLLKLAIVPDEQSTFTYGTSEMSEETVRSDRTVSASSKWLAEPNQHAQAFTSSMPDNESAHLAFTPMYPVAGTLVRSAMPGHSFSLLKVLLIVLVLTSIGTGSIFYYFVIIPNTVASNVLTSQKTMVVEEQTHDHATVPVQSSTSVPVLSHAQTSVPPTQQVDVQATAQANANAQAAADAHATALSVANAQAAANANATAIAQKQARATAAAVALITPMYRLYNGKTNDHFYTASASERDTAIAQDGYVSEGIAGYVFGSQAAGSVPLYRLYSAKTGDHFYTTSASERNTAAAQDGYTFEFIAGYVPGSQVAGSVPLYRLYSAKTGDHFYTTSASERNTAVAQDGYMFESVACYVFVSQNAQ